MIIHALQDLQTGMYDYSVYNNLFWIFLKKQQWPLNEFKKSNYCYCIILEFTKSETMNILWDRTGYRKRLKLKFLFKRENKLS